MQKTENELLEELQKECYREFLATFPFVEYQYLLKLDNIEMINNYWHYSKVKWHYKNVIEFIIKMRKHYGQILFEDLTHQLSLFAKSEWISKNGMLNIISDNKYIN